MRLCDYFLLLIFILLRAQRLQEEIVEAHDVAACGPQLFLVRADPLVSRLLDVHDSLSVGLWSGLPLQ